MNIQTQNPATEELLQSYPVFSRDKTLDVIENAHAAFLQWKSTDFSTRAKYMLNLATLLRKNQNDYAVIMAEEMGKPLTEGRAEIEKCAWACEHFAKHAEIYLTPRSINTAMQKTMVCYQPLGVVFAIMPWNYPFWQVFRFAAPTIMAGNTAILKHAPIATGSGAKIVELFKGAGFPANIFQQIILQDKMTNAVIANDKVRAVTFTGSVKAGRIIGSQALSHLKKVVLELGGNDPCIVLRDANLNLAAEAIVTSRLKNAGQVCIAAKRIIVERPILAELLEKILAKIKNYRMGDPLEEGTMLGPLARKDLRDTLHHQVQDSIHHGAKLLVGGVLPADKGFYYPPTVLIDVVPGMPAFDEELFGPVISVITVENEREAIILANQTSFGLGASIFTQDLEKGERLATYEIEAGSCFVNNYVASDPRVPFGGIKNSGIGRELSAEGMHEFVNIKTVAVQ